MRVKTSHKITLLVFLGSLVAVHVTGEELPFTGAADLCLGRGEVSWTDQFGESVYTIVFPDSVIVGESFDVVLTAWDSFYPNDMVASPWSFLADDSVVDDGFAIFLSDSSWESTYPFLFDTEGIHSFVFTAQDLGHGGGAHNWEWFEIGGTTHVVESSSGIEPGNQVDRGFRLYQGSPNPFVGVTSIGYELAESVPTTLSVHDVCGRLVRILVSSPSPSAGQHTAVWNGKDEDEHYVSCGVYFCRLVAGEYSETHRVVYMRP